VNERMQCEAIWLKVWKAQMEHVGKMEEKHLSESGNMALDCM